MKEEEEEKKEKARERRSRGPEIAAKILCGWAQAMKTRAVSTVCGALWVE